ncbi:glutathione S-transferase family protein [Francisella frigiditurris]|uniref:Glutathione S-transferase n=1 Tax=Francisella frigiditurris TaxID=1542390 RepID=A0A1J0KV27_9GAMM|nr:glutathione S-transferase family protein [Francisella frigiditurris]APC97468.1 hypothetical protein KX01_1786 [Francisella frigiditurris]
MYILYSIPGSCSTAIAILLEKLKVDYKIIHRNDVPNYSKIVPTNQVPALDTGERVISEGAAITLYLLDKHCDSLKKISIEDKGEFYQKLMFNYATLHPSYTRATGTANAMKENKNIEVLQKLADKISELWVIVDNHLSENEFMFGDEATIVDYLITIYTKWAAKFFPYLTVTTGENVKRLAKQISQRPEFLNACKKDGFNF